MADTWPTTVPFFTSGQTLTAGDLNDFGQALEAIGDDWTSYTPSFVSGFSTNYVVTALYRRMGKTYDFDITITFTGAPGGSGVVNVVLPAAPGSTHATWCTLGTASARDASASLSNGGTSVWSGGSNVTAFFQTNRLNVSTPYTWASGDMISLVGRFRVD